MLKIGKVGVRVKIKSHLDIHMSRNSYVTIKSTISFLLVRVLKV